MEFSKLNQKPKNPRHFVALLFIESKRNPKIKEANDYLILIEDKGNIALFSCAYGKFWISKKRKVLSKSFI